MPPHRGLFECRDDHIQHADLVADGDTNDDWRWHTVFGRWCESIFFCRGYAQFACHPDRGGQSYDFNRELSHDSIRRSNATLILYLLVVFAGIFSLSLLEPQASIMALVFECTSALSTVGSSLDLTPTLGSDSKLIIIILMFVGRVGVLTLMSSIIKQKKITKYRYPSDNIIIN